MDRHNFLRGGSAAAQPASGDSSDDHHSFFSMQPTELRRLVGLLGAARSSRSSNRRSYVETHKVKLIFSHQIHCSILFLCTLVATVITMVVLCALNFNLDLA